MTGLYAELQQVLKGETPWKIDGVIPITSAIDESNITPNRSGPIGAIVLAGGRGTRLGIKGPKGCFYILGKSLFEHLLEKGKKADLFIAIMTSPDNHDETKRFLEVNHWFGLDPQRVDLFVQSVVPALSKEGGFIYNINGTRFTTPSGNGALYRSFRDQGVLHKWKKLGVKAVNIVMIDNYLADPADLKCISLIQEKGAEIVMKAIERGSPDEKVGLFGVKNGRLVVQEYFELVLNDKVNLDWKYCNTGMFSASLDFLEKAADIKLPWHLVEKGDHYQFENFIFDSFPKANKFFIVHYPRKTCFAPIKSKTDIEWLIANQ
jgi:UDP-N-acetylglucosamine pyrophosphorylase